MRLRMSIYLALLELNLEWGATLDQIKASYRRLAKMYHPDMNRTDPDASRKFIRIHEAYETAKRQVEYGWGSKSQPHRRERRASTPPPPPPPPPKPKPKPKPRPQPQSFPEWRRSSKGNLWCEINGHHLVIIPDRFAVGSWVFAIDGEFFKGRYLSEDLTKEAALKAAGFTSYESKTKEYVPNY